MNIWILRWQTHDSSEVLGVYSTVEKANAAEYEVEDEYEEQQGALFIDEYEVD